MVAAKVLASCLANVVAKQKAMTSTTEILTVWSSVAECSLSDTGITLSVQ